MSKLILAGTLAATLLALSNPENTYLTFANWLCGLHPDFAQGMAAGIVDEYGSLDNMIEQTHNKNFARQFAGILKAHTEH